MKAWLIVFLAALYVSASLIGAAKAAPATPSQSEAETKQWVLTIAKDATFSALDAKAYLGLFDKIAPATKTTVPDQLIAVSSASHKSVLLLSCNAGCLALQGFISKTVYSKILQDLGGI
jgi:hypothetical protein